MRDLRHAWPSSNHESLPRPSYQPLSSKLPTMWSCIEVHVKRLRCRYASRSRLSSPYTPLHPQRSTPARPVNSPRLGFCKVSGGSFAVPRAMLMNKEIHKQPEASQRRRSAASRPSLPRFRAHVFSSLTSGRGVESHRQKNTR